jgi:UDP-glucose 4-epimerase
MKVLVTGGAGFIGANLVRHLHDQAWVTEITVLDDLSTGDERNLEGLPVRFVRGSILDHCALDSACDGMDAVVHLAAVPSVPRSLEDPLRSHHANATGTLEVVQAVRRAGRPHLLVASSSSVYGSNPSLPKHEQLRPMPMSPYAVSKLAAETYALAAAACFDVPVLAFRFFNVFGPLQPAGHAYAAVVPAFMDAALRGRPLTLHGDGSQTRDFTFVGTVCQVLTESLLRHVVHTDPVNLAYGSRTSLLELVRELEELLGRTLQVDRRPARAGDVPHSQSDGALLRSLLPAVQPVPLREGLAATLSWARSAPALAGA